VSWCKHGDQESYNQEPLRQQAIRNIWHNLIHVGQMEGIANQMDETLRFRAVKFALENELQLKLFAVNSAVVRLPI
jgi:hypothetical protein